MDEIGHGLVGSYPQITEALRRRRVEASSADRFVERLLGLELTQAHFDRGAAFIAGVLERAGKEGLERLWSSADVLPTPNEVDAPGLWLARIDMGGDLTRRPLGPRRPGRDPRRPRRSRRRSGLTVVRGDGGLVGPRRSVGLARPRVG